MKQSLFIGALAVLALTACSQDEVVDVNQHGNELTFSTVANKSSRAANYWSSAKAPGTITVWAYTSAGAATGADKVFFEASEYTKAEGATEYTNDLKRFWPEATNPLNFYAIAGTTATPSYAASAMTVADYTVSTTLANQEDMLYAVALGCTKPANGVQPLNFRHALAQVVFKGKLDPTKKLHVEVSGVQVCNIDSKGSFVYSADTKGQFIESADGKNNNDAVTGTWSYGATPTLATYATTFAAKTLTGEAQDLTSEAAGDALLLLPQTVEKPYVANPGAPNSDGVCLKVACNIFNIAGATFDAAKDVPVFEGTITIPLAKIDWKPGKKYIYTLNFGGDGGGLDEKDDPVLTPISFSLTVDDFDVVEEEVVNTYK